ncbi:hypothetical protein Anapl_02212 [Anas platyrhynchos]|uniref:Uncharacterized protein n=1 Tax=Anas platyrhynchos TaxID=8839 RepID=R0K1T3_ANAPL|nr:hypothetical protein Anapl_02212 [Anas platyrhynchos]
MDICGVRAATLGQDQGHGDGREIKNSVPTSSRTWVQEHQPVLGVAELLGIGEAGLSKSRCRLTQGQEGSAQAPKTPGRLYCEGKGKNSPRTHQEQVDENWHPPQCSARLPRASPVPSTAGHPTNCVRPNRCFRFYLFPTSSSTPGEQKHFRHRGNSSSNNCTFDAAISLRRWSGEILQHPSSHRTHSLRLEAPRCSRQRSHCTAAAAVCATRDRDRLEATEYCTDCNEIWRLTKPHPAQRAEGNLNCFSKGAGLPKTSTSGKGAEPHGAGLAAGSPEALTPKAGKLGEGDSPPEREQPGWKPGHGLEADQSEMVGDDHLGNFNHHHEGLSCCATQLE